VVARGWGVGEGEGTVNKLLMIRVTPENYDAWLPAHMAGEEARLEYGITEGPFYREVKNPHVALLRSMSRTCNAPWAGSRTSGSSGDKGDRQGRARVLRCGTQVGWHPARLGSRVE